MQLSSVYASVWLHESCDLDMLVPRQHVVRATILLSRGVVRLRCSVNGIQSGMNGLRCSVNAFRRWNEPAPLWSQRFAPDGKRRRCGATQSHRPVKRSLQGMNGSLEHAEDSFLPVY